MTLKAHYLRRRREDKQAPWKSQLDAKLTVQRRPLWLPGSAQAHRVFHSPVATTPSTHPPTPCAPRRRQTLLSGGELSLHIINCNNWQVGHWLLASNPPGAHERKTKKFLDAPQLIFSLGSEKLQPFTSETSCGRQLS